MVIFSESVAYREMEVTSRFILSGYFFDFLFLSVFGRNLVALHKCYFVGQQVADPAFYFPMFFSFPRKAQVYGIARHFIGIGYAHGLFITTASYVSAYAGYTFTYAVVEYGGSDASLFVTVGETRVDEVGAIVPAWAGLLPDRLRETLQDS